MTAGNVTAIVILTLLGVVLFDFVRSYLASRKSGWARLLDAGKGSATILWTQLGFAAAAVVAALDQVADWICQITGMPGADDAFKGAIQQAVTPTRVGVAVAIYVAITAIARMRTLGKS